MLKASNFTANPPEAPAYGIQSTPIGAIALYVGITVGTCSIALALTVLLVERTNSVAWREGRGAVIVADLAASILFVLVLAVLSHWRAATKPERTRNTVLATAAIITFCLLNVVLASIWLSLPVVMI